MGWVAPLVLLTIAASPSTPAWDSGEMKRLLSHAQAAARAPSLPAQNQALLVMAASAYRSQIGTGDPEAIAKRILRDLEPDHPNVKKGQWLNALLRRFYDDAAARCLVLGRFSRSRDDRQFFGVMAQQSKAAADQLAQTLELRVEGLQGFTALLPVVDGDKPYSHVSQAVVSASGAITVDGMERVRFAGHRPPADVQRTGKGALRKLFAALRFIDQSARSLARYDKAWAKKRGHLRTVVPARFPAVYFNEIARAAREARMRRLHVMVMTKRGELRELAVDLKKSRRKKKRGASVPVTCADDITMTLCAERIAYARKKGRPYWATP